MSRLRAARAAIAVLAVLGPLAAAAGAGAAGWQGPATISEPTADSGASPVIALGRSGDAGAVWIDNVAPGGRIALARKRAGATWSAPVTAATPVASTPLFAGVDGEGSITAAYTTAGVATLLTWAATAPAPAAATVPGDLTVTDLAVDGAGDAVIAGLSGSPAGLSVGYRKGAAGAFSFRTYTYADLGFAAVTSARVALNASGRAIVAFVAGAKLGAVTRTATTDWPATYETAALTNVSGAPGVGIDEAGNAVIAYTYTSGAVQTVRDFLRSAGGTYAPSGDLSPATMGTTVTSLSAAVNPAGTAALVWLQSTAATQSVKARLGTTANGFLGPNPEDVNDAGAMEPAAALADDGSLVAVWERSTTGGNVGQARVRAAGASGTWGDTRALTSAHPNATFPSLASDGKGDWATLTSPYDGTRHPVVLSAYDARPPTLTTPTLTGGPFAGIPVTLATTASDAWSAVAAPVWTFGDGGTATGLSVAHTYAAGTYTAHVSVTDALGNTSGMDVTVVAKEAAVTLEAARFAAKWKRSRVGGTLTVAGTAPISGSYVLDVFRGATRRIHVTLKLAPGAYSRAIRLPATLLPGSHHLTLTPSAKGVTAAALDVVLAPPSEGVVDVVALSRTRSGKALHTARGAATLWARFHFAAVPKPSVKVKITWYRTYKGKRTTLAKLLKTPSANVSSSVALRGRKGTITAVLTRGGKIIVQSAARVT